MIKVLVFSKFLAEHVRMFDDNTLVISITSPGSEEADIKGKYVHKFQFHDVREDLMLDSGIMNAMTPEMAESIAQVMMNHQHLKRWVIHCEAGVSRSPGVAIGAARYIDLDPGVEKLIERFPCYNKHVKKMIEKALREKMEEIDEQIDKSACQGEEW
jgi:predicted protein tyrosine phosphatase